MPRRSADRLNQRALGAEEALFVGVEDCDQRHFGDIEPFAQQVDADQHVEFAQPQVADDLDALDGVDVRVQIADLDAMVLGANSDAIASRRAVTVQALGGTGGLKIGADFLRKFAPGAKVWISDPSWENHRALFEGAGFTVETYPYYDATTRGLDFDGMMAKLGGLPPGAIVVLHACCHNPTGADPTSEQWVKILEIVRSRGLVPFLDIAYQGFADGIDADDAWSQARPPTTRGAPVT